MRETRLQQTSWDFLWVTGDNQAQKQGVEASMQEERGALVGVS